jgi:hypothetical protein
MLEAEACLICLFPELRPLLLSMLLRQLLLVVAAFQVWGIVHMNLSDQWSALVFPYFVHLSHVYFSVYASVVKFFCKLALCSYTCFNVLLLQMYAHGVGCITK